MKRLVLALVLLAGAAANAWPQARDNAADYALAPGDNIRILVYQNPDLTLETRITENGTITYPMIGAVRIGGMTASAAEQAIAKALAAGDFVHDPQVNVVVLQMRGNQVSVLGQVNKPGRVALETVNMRVSEVLAIAGGIASGGADSAVIAGVRNGKPFRREVEVASVFLDGRSDDDVVVAAGDVIYVHRAPVFYIYGEVQKPGSYRVERNMTVRQALAQAGGPTSKGTERRPTRHRRDGSKMVEASADLNDPVVPDDVFYVRETLF